MGFSERMDTILNGTQAELYKNTHTYIRPAEDLKEQLTWLSSFFSQ